MAVKIRLRRVGAKKQPAYRLVIADSRAPRDGRFIEIVGSYNPLTNPATIVINYERALYWLRQGAQPTEVVQHMFVRKGLWDVFTGKAEFESLLLVAPVVEAEIVPAVVVAEVVEAAAPVEEAAVAEVVVEAAPAEEEVVAEEVVEEAAPAEEVVVAEVVEEATPAEEAVEETAPVVEEVAVEEVVEEAVAVEAVADDAVAVAEEETPTV